MKKNDIIEALSEAIGCFDKPAILYCKVIVVETIYVIPVKTGIHFLGSGLHRELSPMELLSQG